MTGLLNALATLFAPCSVPVNLVNDIPFICDEAFMGFMSKTFGANYVGVEENWMNNVYPHNLSNALQTRYGATDLSAWMYSNNAGQPYGYEPTNLQLQYYPNYPQCN